MERPHDWIVLELTFNLITQNIRSSQAAHSFFFLSVPSALATVNNVPPSNTVLCLLFFHTKPPPWSSSSLPLPTSASCYWHIHCPLIFMSRSSQSAVSTFKNINEALPLWCTDAGNLVTAKENLYILCLLPLVTIPDFLLSASRPVFSHIVESQETHF